MFTACIQGTVNTDIRAMTTLPPGKAMRFSGDDEKEIQGCQTVH